MTVKLFNDCKGKQFALHILPSMSVYITNYMGEVSFSWLIWTIEFRLWDEV